MQEAFILVINPPPVRGIGTGGGFKMYDRGPARPRAAGAGGGRPTSWSRAPTRSPAWPSVFTLFNTRTPKVYADIDRAKAEMLGVPVGQRVRHARTSIWARPTSTTSTISAAPTGCSVQADGQFRREVRDIADLKTRNARGDMVPLGSVATFRDLTGAYRVPHYNLYPAAEVQGSTAARLLHRPGDRRRWSTWRPRCCRTASASNGPSSPTRRSSPATPAIFVFIASVVFVFLFLAAQYESWLLPLAVILIVPMCLLAAIIGVLFRGLDNNILVQIGLIVLVGLAAKNAILIVEFARAARGARARAARRPPWTPPAPGCARS